MKCEESLEFIRQALIDFGATLPQSARAAYDQVAERHFDNVVAAMEEQGEKKATGRRSKKE